MAIRDEQNKGGADTLLEIQNLHVKFTTERATGYALNGVNLKIRQGESLGLVGESGAGKTTTALSVLRLLSKAGRITDGQILFHGKDVMKMSKRELLDMRGRRIAMIFQNPLSSLNPVFTVGEQISMVLRHHLKMSPKQADARTRELLESVGIPGYRINDYPSQFSGGMRQRVGIAAGIACNPELLIADEPTTALDVTIQAQVLKMMRSLRDKFGTSMILITHDFGVVAQMCDKVAVMYDGRIVEYGRAEDIFLGEDHHPYTKGLFRSIPTISTSQERLQPIPGLMPDPTQQYTGCSFQPRCTYCREICGQQKPTYATEGEHQILCHFPHSREQVEGGDFHE